MVLRTWRVMAPTSLGKYQKYGNQASPVDQSLKYQNTVQSRHFRAMRPMII